MKNNQEKLIRGNMNGFFHVKLQPKLCILMMNPKHCEPAQTVLDHAPWSFTFHLHSRAGAGTDVCVMGRSTQVCTLGGGGRSALRGYSIPGCMEGHSTTYMMVSVLF